MAYCFEQVRLARRHPPEGITGANLGDRTFIAIKATIVPHLKEERPVPKPVAAFNALGAPNTEPLIDRVFVIGILNIAALNGRCRA